MSEVGYGRRALEAAEELQRVVDLRHRGYGREERNPLVLALGWIADSPCEARHHELAREVLEDWAPGT